MPKTFRITSLLLLLAFTCRANAQTTQTIPKRSDRNAAATQPVPAVETTTSPNGAYPPIRGLWQEAPAVFLVITQENGEWTAKCAYTLKDFGEVRWEMKGTLTPDGKIGGTLYHTSAPKDWSLSQARDAKLSEDGNTISGTAKWPNGGDTFTWTWISKPDPIVEQLQQECEQLRQRLKSAREAYRSARAAATQRLSQTPGYEAAESALAAAQKEQDDANSSDAQMQAAQDKVNAQATIESPTASDSTVVAAANLEAQVNADFITAQARFDRAQAVESATEEVAAQAAEKDAADAAMPPIIKSAMAQHELAVGMTLDQCNESIGKDGRITGADVSGETYYEWYLWSGPGNSFLTTFNGVIVNNRLVSFTKGPAQPSDAPAPFVIP